MTKKAIRVLSVSYLDIEEGLKVLDIGSGTGSISLQCALFGGRVTAIERKEEAVELLKENAKVQNLDLELIHGLAPKDLPKESFDRVFIGGSAGNLEGIFTYLDEYLLPGGILVGNFITLKNTWKMYDLLKQFNYKEVEVELVQTAKLDHLGLLKGENPIYIMKGVKA